MKIESCLVSRRQSCWVNPETAAAVELWSSIFGVSQTPWTAHHITDCPASPSHTSILIGAFEFVFLTGSMVRILLGM